MKKMTATEGTNNVKNNYLLLELVNSSSFGLVFSWTTFGFSPKSIAPISACFCRLLMLLGESFLVKFDFLLSLFSIFKELGIISVLLLLSLLNE